MTSGFAPPPGAQWIDPETGEVKDAPELPDMPARPPTAQLSLFEGQEIEQGVVALSGSFGLDLYNEGHADLMRELTLGRPVKLTLQIGTGPSALYWDLDAEVGGRAFTRKPNKDGDQLNITKTTLKVLDGKAEV